MLIVPAPAKLNLALAVVARRPDGWHDIDTVLVPIDWHDLIGIDVRPATMTSVELRLTGPASAGVPDGDRNLAARAARALAGAAGIPMQINLWLDKRVPHGAGLGGGSADAAAALQAGARRLAALGRSVNRSALREAALSVGSDVPALLAGVPSRVAGRGERVTPIASPSLDVVVVSTVPSSTADTYAAVTEQDMVSDGRVSRLIDALTAGESIAGALLGSALERAAVQANPAVGQAIARARASVPEVAWHLTGSGGALCAVATTTAEARALARRMRDAGFAARACRTLAAPG